MVFNILISFREPGKNYISKENDRSYIFDRDVDLDVLENELLHGANITVKEIIEDFKDFLVRKV